MKRHLHFFFQVPAGAMEESSEEDDDSNVQDDIKNIYIYIYITNKIFMIFFFFFFVKFGVNTPSELKAYASA